MIFTTSLIKKKNAKQFEISKKFNFKKRKISFKSLISPSFDQLYCSPIVHINHIEPIFQGPPFYCTKKVPRNPLPAVCSDLDLLISRQDSWLQDSGFRKRAVNH